jgi:adenylate cyclase
MTALVPQDLGTRKRRLRIPIWLVLVLVLGGMTSVMALVIGVRFYVAGVTSTRELVEDLGRSVLSQLSGTVSSQLQPAADQADFLADLLSRDQVDPKDNQRLRDLLLGSLAAVRQLRAVAYVGLDHRAVRAGPDDRGRGYIAEVTDIGGEPQILALLEEAKTHRGSFWSEPVLFDWSEGPLLIAVSPVFHDGGMIGIVWAAVSVHSISDQLALLSNTIEFMPFVLTSEGRILMHGRFGDMPPGREWSGSAILPSRAEFPDPVLVAMPWPLDFDSFDDERNRQPGDFAVDGVELPTGSYFLIYRQLAGYGTAPWIIGYHLQASWLDRSIGVINDAIPFALIVLAVALGLAFWVGRSIAKPMHILSQSGQRLARLDFTPLEIKESRIKEVTRAIEAQRAMRNGLQWLSNYIPRSLTPLLMQSDEVLASRERDVVVLFTDIVGFSKIAEGRRAGSVAALLNRHFGLLGAIIEEEGGTIDKYIGDSVMAFWGAPLDQEDRAERAVRAARRIARKLHADNARRGRKGLKPIRIRIGLHKGPALVGNIGAPGRVNYTLVGDTVNLAQRLEQFGREFDDGTSDAVIAISGELAQVLPPDVPLLDRGDQVFHGRSNACHVFQVQAGLTDA